MGQVQRLNLLNPSEVQNDTQDCTGWVSLSKREMASNAIITCFIHVVALFSPVLVALGWSSDMTP